VPFTLDNSLTPDLSLPKMAVHTAPSKSNEAAEMSQAQTRSTGSRNLFHMIATDLHFWIPFAVLVGGLLLLDKLR
jgi:hypothetical protein